MLPACLPLSPRPLLLLPPGPNPIPAPHASGLDPPTPTTTPNFLPFYRQPFFLPPFSGPSPSLTTTTADFLHTPLLKFYPESFFSPPIVYFFCHWWRIDTQREKGRRRRLVSRPFLSLLLYLRMYYKIKLCLCGMCASMPTTRMQSFMGRKGWRWQRSSQVITPFLSFGKEGGERLPGGMDGRRKGEENYFRAIGRVWRVERYDIGN